MKKLDYDKIISVKNLLGISYEDLAIKAGMSKSGIVDGIKHKRLSVDSLEKIAEALEKSPAYFFEETTEPVVDLKKKIAEVKRIINELEKGL
jgi:transcriptional regulator with XRE-family HTH domain